MKECPKCGKKHDKKGIFCSSKCANSRTFTEESKRKTSESLKLFHKPKQDKKEIIDDLIVFYEEKKKKQKTVDKTWNECSIYEHKNFVVKEQNYKCNRCTIDEWCGEKIVLELEHKDGDRTNNKRENLEALCPNCHSLTKTWRGRNIFQKKKISEKLFLETMLSEASIYKALIKLGLAPKGNNYKRAKQILDKQKAHSLVG